MLPGSPRSLIVLGLLGALFLLMPAIAALTGINGLMSLATRILIYAVAVVSLDLILGFGAMVSFGHAMFFGLGGYAVGIIGYHAAQGDLLPGSPIVGSALFVWPIALVACALLGLIVGLLALKTRGVQFIMITLAFAQMVFFLLVSIPSYGGDDGLIMESRNTLPFLDLSKPLPFYYLCLAILVAWLGFCRMIVRSRFGLVLQALRQSERRALNLGVRALPFRLLAFVISAVGTGLAGVLWANFAKFVTPDMTAWTKSGEFMAIIILGGLGTLVGPIIGAAAFLGLEDVLKTWTEHWAVVMGPVLVLIALLGRRGLAGLLFGLKHEG